MADHIKNRISIADLRISGLDLTSVERGGPDPLRKLELSRLEIADFAVAFGAVSCRVETLLLETIQTALGRGQLSAQTARLCGLSMAARTASGASSAGAPSDAIEVTAPLVELPRGFLVTGDHEVFAPQVVLEDVRVAIHDFMSLFRRKPPDEQPESRVDLHFLDTLHGRLDIDLAVDMTLPWIGRRRVTHYFRIPIDNGTIDYEQLESDVHWLEAAFLTIHPVDDELVLARDLPLVPYSRKTLLSWPLEPADIPLTDYRRVHVRNLLRWRLPPQKARKQARKQTSSDPEATQEKPSDKEKSRLVLHALAMENIKLDLHVGAPAQIFLPGGTSLQFGDRERPGLSGLSITGAIRHQAAPASGEPTALRGQVELVDATLEDISLGTADLSMDRIHVTGIEDLELAFQGFKPARLEFTISQMTVTNLRIRGTQE